MRDSMSIPFEFEAAAPGGNALLTITMDEGDSRKVHTEKAFAGGGSSLFRRA